MTNPDFQTREQTLYKHWDFSVRSASCLLLIACCLLLVGAGNAQGTQVLIVPASSVVAPGDTITVEIQVRDVVDLYGVDIRLTFDAAKLEVQDADGNPANGVQIAPGNFLDPAQGFLAQNTVDNTIGQVRYVLVLMTPAPAVSGSGALARITFRALSPGSSELDFADVLLANQRAEPIPAAVSGGVVIVSGGTATPLPMFPGLFLPLMLQGYPSATPSPTPTASPTPLPTPHHMQLILNPSFETNEAWEILQTACPAGYSVSRARSGLRSMRLGITSPYPERAYSSVRQTVEIPSRVEEAQLSFYYFPVSSSADGDYIYFILLRASDGARLRTISWMDRNQTWNQRTFDLLEYAGQAITLWFGVYNDGDGVTAVYLDDVELWVASSE